MEIKNYPKILAYATIVLAFATVVLAIATGILAIETIKLSNSNEKLTNITLEYYGYHLPKVSLIQGNVANLYVFRDNNSGPYLTVLGLASVYNSAESDDIALIRHKYIGTSFRPYANNIIKLHTVQGNSIQSYEIDIGNNDTISVEGNQFPIPISPGEQKKDIPLLITYKPEDIVDLNTPIGLVILEEITIIEIIHPVEKTILTNLTALKSTNITYIMGEDTAIVKSNDGNTYNIEVRYTEDVETYRDWKKMLLRPYGSSLTV